MLFGIASSSEMLLDMEHNVCATFHPIRNPQTRSTFQWPELAGTLRRRTARFYDTCFTLDLHEGLNVLNILEHPNRTVKHRPNSRHRLHLHHPKAPAAHILSFDAARARELNKKKSISKEQNGKTQVARRAPCKTPSSRGFLKFGLARFLATLY